jgi:hypothetical protein
MLIREAQKHKDPTDLDLDADRDPQHCQKVRWPDTTGTHWGGGGRSCALPNFFFSGGGASDELGWAGGPEVSDGIGYRTPVGFPS